MPSSTTQDPPSSRPEVPVENPLIMQAAGEPSAKSTILALPLQLTPHTTLHIQLTSHATCTIIFITTSDPSTASSLSALGSFIYAMPNVGCRFLHLWHELWHICSLRAYSDSNRTSLYVLPFTLFHLLQSLQLVWRRL